MHPSLIRSAIVAATMLATATGVGVATSGQGAATAKRVITAYNNATDFRVRASPSRERRTTDDVEL